MQVSVFACKFVLWIVRVGTVVVALRAYQTVRGRLLTPVASVKVVPVLYRKSRIRWQFIGFVATGVGGLPRTTRAHVKVWMLWSYA